ncbi:transposable element Tc1 transposase [Trichonephila clavipes]|uniref:Transposable element Tc1 transposase n=1 Tax=Trichonephila clavipes TaxID=2585209 RepID=A0A8X6R6R7_TRICX|nr:transposable element Tc1 transposase [Trichonephila clavipes]
MTPPKRGKFPKTTQTMMYLWVHCLLPGVGNASPFSVGATQLGIGSSFRFQHDYDPKHTTETVKLWLLYNVANQLHTPPQSPDLNPTEHLWDLLEREIRQHDISSKDMLESVLKVEWENISTEETT